MKGDFSRLRLIPEQHDAVWLEQQGRVRLDSDANEAELTRLLLDRLQSEDVVGASGAPAPGTGFRITPLGTDDLAIGGGSGPAGRFYVDGILCQNETASTYTNQADLPAVPPLPVPQPAPPVGWVSLASGPNVVGHRALLLADGSVLVVGGAAGGGPATAAVERFTLVRSWLNVAPPMQAARSVPAAAVVGGGALVAGGLDEHGVALATAELFDGAAWSAAGSLAAARSSATATPLATGQVLVAGGQDGPTVLASAELYDPSGRTWSAAGPMADARTFHTATALPDGTVLVAGGAAPGGRRLATAEIYDPDSLTWRSAGRMVTARAGHSAVLLADGRVLVAGGINHLRFPDATAEIYDPRDGRWHGCGPMRLARSDHTATLLPSGMVLVAGGRVVTGSLIAATTEAELFDPFTSSFLAAQPLRRPRYGHTAVLLGDGSVLVAGGAVEFGSELYQPGSGAHAVVYLEAWRRLVASCQDPSIREVALNGPDTTVRLRTVAQVRVVAVDERYNAGGVGCDRARALLPGPGSGTLSTVVPPPPPVTSECELPDPANFTGRENRLYRVEVHDPGDVLGVVPLAFALDGAAAAGSTTLTLSASLTGRDVVSLLGKRWDLDSEPVTIVDAAPAASRVRLGAPLRFGHAAGAPLAQPPRGVPVGAARGTHTFSVGGVTDERLLRGRWFLRSGSTFEPVTIVAALDGAVTLAADLANDFSKDAWLTPWASFKWSRSNASFAVRVIEYEGDGATLHVDSLGQDQATALRAGQWVEVIGDSDELSAGRGQLRQVASDPDPDAAGGPAVTVAPALVGLPPVGTGNLLVRRWDGVGQAQAAFDPIATPDMDLDREGVHVEFGGQDLRAGDFWWFTARAVDGSVENLYHAPPAGVDRHECPLAVLRWRFDGTRVAEPSEVLEALDCAPVFDPLTALRAARVGVDDSGCGFGASTVQEAIDGLCARLVASAIAYDPGGCTDVQGATTVQEAIDALCVSRAAAGPRVVRVSWPNDRPMALAAFNQGLQVTISEPMDPATLTGSTFRVDLDVPMGLGVIPTPSGRVPAQLAGSIAADSTSSTFTWTPNPLFSADSLRELLADRLDLSGGDDFPRSPGIRCRVTLRGNCILAPDGVPLDGDAFGVATPDPFRPFTDLTLPSGDGVRGGDFESWFFLGLPVEVVRVSPQNNAIFATALQPGSSITVFFDKAIDPNTLDANSLRVLDPSGKPLPGTITLEGGVATFTPVGGFPGPAGGATSAVYRLVASGSRIRDVDGFNLAGDGSGTPGTDFTSRIGIFTWAATTPMAVPRTQHTATVQGDGRVLVAGGLNTVGLDFVVLDSAELYDPAARTWSPAGKMQDARASHTATLLRDGRVLVAGGADPNSVRLASVDIYDPVTGGWTAVAPLSTPRVGHAAVLLADGRVLVVGGWAPVGGGSAATPTTEVYDATSNTWTPGPPLSLGRANLSATVLQDGRVLVVGGDAAAQGAQPAPQAVAEIIDPSARAVTVTAPLSVARTGHTATLLGSGQVLVVGGAVGPTAELFTPDSLAWKPVGSPLAAISFQTAALLPWGPVLIAGGILDDGSVRTSELYGDGLPDVPFVHGAQMVAARTGHAMTVLRDGQVLVTGGQPPLSAAITLSSAELYGGQ